MKPFETGVVCSKFFSQKDISKFVWSGKKLEKTKKMSPTSVF
jgi:hypothetical protein